MVSGKSELAQGAKGIAPVASPPIRHSFFWMLVGNGTFSLAQWGRVAVLAKLGSPAVVGQYALALAIVSPIFMLTNLQLSAVQATDARDQYEFSDFATLRLLCSGIAMAAIAMLVLALRWTSTVRLLVLVLMLGVAADSLSEVFGGLQQKHERIDRLGISLAMRAVLSLTLFAAVFRFSHSVVAAVTALPVASMLVLATWDVSRSKQVLRDAPLLAWQGRRLRDLARFSLPLGVIMMLISLNVNIPRYLLERSSGSAELGIFASLSYVVMAVGLIVNGLGQSASARLARFYAAGDMSSFRGLIMRFCGIGVLLGLCCVGVAAVFGRALLSLIYRPEYAAHLDVFLVLAGTSGVSAVASFIGYGITAAQAFRYQVWTMLATMMTTALAALLLVPRYHAMGAALSLLISALVSGSTCAAILHRALRVRQTTDSQ